MKELFETLSANNSRNFKTDFLKQNQDNSLLKEVIRLALDPYTQFYIKKIPAYTKAVAPSLSIEDALNQLKLLSSRTVTGNAAIAHLTNILEECEEPEVIVKIIKKDLDCGVSVSTANAVWKDLITEYPCMTCSAYDEKLVDKVKFPAYVQLKEDGMRFAATVKDGKCDFRSRNGRVIDLLGNLEQEFIALANGMDCVFDGELLVVSEDGSTLDRKTGNGILNKAVKGTISSDEANQVRATIWDLIPLEEFNQLKYKVPYSERYDTLLSMMNSYSTSKINLIETNIVDSKEEAVVIFEEYLAKGLEGIILKDANSIWESKRSKGQIKFKGEEESDLLVTAVQEGTGKYTGMLGALICESADGIIQVSVGSGFTDEQRKSDETWIGKIVTVKYNARIKNKQGKESLFLPVFIELRQDKDTADTSDKIK